MWEGGVGYVCVNLCEYNRGCCQCVLEGAENQKGEAGGEVVGKRGSGLRQARGVMVERGVVGTGRRDGRGQA